ncbi:hypothetical protein GDO86_016165 [Hymenochirus boettgeri]|uniref:Uncharacterized protein n=1 Tax=Hymenochirus boettgeri TaxID=247094 RepID=A0A8T2JYH3_9PIPI|nr:hypothetical protein GDO86_016165 [Hymenochirus boettgeri]
MGLNGSKTTHKVRKVAPLETKDIFISPAHLPGFSGSTSFSTYGKAEELSATYGHHLPPLRETLHGRGLAVPRPISFDVSLENGDETSIIKKHPPRRIQKLEPVVLPTIMSAERITGKQDTDSARKGKEVERKGQVSKNTMARRQHTHKMQMQEINRKREELNRSQAELKRNLHRETKINKQKMREHKARKLRENCLRYDDEDKNFLVVETDPTFNVDRGNRWHWNMTDPGSTTELPIQKKGKLEMWFKDYQDGRNMHSDSSSTDSLDSWIIEDRRCHQRPSLIRTKAEKIPMFDEFFDREF